MSLTASGEARLRVIRFDDVSRETFYLHSPISSKKTAFQPKNIVISSGVNPWWSAKFIP